MLTPTTTRMLRRPIKAAQPPRINTASKLLAACFICSLEMCELTRKELSPHFERRIARAA
jgi:hypothetical protein